MEEIISWLMSVEKIANEFYLKASVYFKKNEQLSKFLKSLSDDEMYHFQIMKIADKYLKETGIFYQPVFLLDESVRDKIFTPFEENSKKLHDGVLLEEDIYKCLLNSEFSEWNDIFIYILSLLSKQKIEFQVASSNIQKHLSKLGYFFNNIQGLKQYYDELIKIPKIWNTKILIIDDEEPIRNLIASLLKKFYSHIEKSVNGEEAFGIISENYFDLIISDINMPVLDGIGLYEKLLKIPHFNSKTLLFMSGSSGNEENIKKYGLNFIRKPFIIQEFLDEVKKIAG